MRDNFVGEKKISKSYNRVKQSPYTIRFTLEEPIKIRSSNIYNKIIYKLKKYKMKLLK